MVWSTTHCLCGTPRISEIFPFLHVFKKYQYNDLKLLKIFISICEGSGRVYKSYSGHVMAKLSKHQIQHYLFPCSRLPIDYSSCCLIIIVTYLQKLEMGKYLKIWEGGIVFFFFPSVCMVSGFEADLVYHRYLMGLQDVTKVFILV